MADIIILMKELGYPTDEKGVCRGLAIMAARAHLCKEYPKFEGRMAFLKRLEQGELKESVEKAKEKNTADYKKKNSGEILSEEESKNQELLLSIEPFFSQVWAHFSPSAIQKFLGVKEKEIDELLGIKGKAMLSQYDVSTVEKLMYGDKTQDGDLSMEILPEPDKLMLFTSDDDDYLHMETFLTKVQRSNISASLVINSSNHTVNLSYDYQTQEWCLTNHSVLSRHSSIDSALNAVVSAFGKNGVSNLSVEFYTNNNSPKKEKLIQDLKKISEHSVQTLLESDDVNRVDDYGATALYVASRQGDLNVVKQLLENKNTNVDVLQDGLTALCIAAKEGHLAIVSHLLANGANVNHFRQDKVTALYMAAQNGHLDVVDYLLNHGADVKRHGLAAFHMAVKNGHLAVVECFLNHPEIKINESMGNSNLTAFHIAAMAGHIDIVKKLLNFQDIHVNQKASDITAFYLAVLHGHREVAECLMNYPEFDETEIANSLSAAIEKGHASVAMLLLDKMDDVNEVIKALGEAIDLGHLSLVRALLDRDEIKGNDKALHASLKKAISNGQLDIVDYLVNRKEIDINAFVDKNSSALHIAAQTRDARSLDFLLKQQGINVNQEDGKGLTALYRAVYFGGVDKVERLLEHAEIDVNVVTREGQSAFQLIVKGDGKGSFLQHAQMAHAFLEHPKINLLQVIQDLEKGGSGLHTADCFLLKAHAYFKLGSYDQALPIYKSLLDDEPKESVLWLSMKADIRKKAAFISNKTDQKSDLKEMHSGSRYFDSRNRYFKSAANTANNGKQVAKNIIGGTLKFVRRIQGGK